MVKSHLYILVVIISFIFVANTRIGEGISLNSTRWTYYPLSSPKCSECGTNSNRYCSEEFGLVPIDKRKHLKSHCIVFQGPKRMEPDEVVSHLPSEGMTLVFAGDSNTRMLYLEALKFFDCETLFEDTKKFAQSTLGISADGTAFRRAVDHTYMCSAKCRAATKGKKITLAFLWRPYFDTQLFDGRPWKKCQEDCALRTTREGITFSKCDEGDIQTAKSRWRCGKTLNSPRVQRDSPLVVVQGAGIHDAIHRFPWFTNAHDKANLTRARESVRAVLRTHSSPGAGLCWLSNTKKAGLEVLLPPLELQVAPSVPTSWAGNPSTHPRINALLSIIREEQLNFLRFNSLFNYTAPCTTLTSMQKGPWSPYDGVHYDKIVYRACLSIILKHVLVLTKGDEIR